MCRAQYSHVRYQPEHRDFRTPEPLDSNYYRVPDIEESNYGVPADSYQVPSYTYLSPPEVQDTPNTSGIAQGSTNRLGLTQGTDNTGVSRGTPLASPEVPLGTLDRPGVPQGTPLNSRVPQGTPWVSQGNDGSFEDDGLKGLEVETVEGAYYVLLPGSRLQRVHYRTENDARRMAYTARLRYSAEEKVPIFVYTPRQNPSSAAYVEFNKQ